MMLAAAILVLTIVGIPTVIRRLGIRLLARLLLGRHDPTWPYNMKGQIR